MAYAILRIKKHRQLGTLAASGKHTFREQPTPNSDGTPNMHIGAQSTDQLLDFVRARVAECDEKAADAVQCVEFLITASPGAFERHGGWLNDKSAYFRDAIKWLKDEFGAKNLMSASIHLDETTPHLVAYVVPVVTRAAGVRNRSVIVGKGEDGKTIRETRQYPVAARQSLSAKHYFGGKAKMQKLQTNFAVDVARHHKLQRGVASSKAKHVEVKTWYGLLAAEAAAKSEQLRNIQSGQQMRNFLRGLTGAQQRDDVAELKAKAKKLEEERDAEKAKRQAVETELANRNQADTRRIAEMQKREHELDAREAKLKPQPVHTNERDVTNKPRGPRM